MVRGRFPRSVYARGSEPDVRFSLANERTFLAWLRTALALLAAGVALEALGLPAQDGLRLVAAGVLVLLGMLAAVRGWTGWVSAERALRSGTPLPGPSAGPVLVGGVVAAAALILAGMLA